MGQTDGDTVLQLCHKKVRRWKTNVLHSAACERSLRCQAQRQPLPEWGTLAATFAARAVTNSILHQQNSHPWPVLVG